MATYTSLNPLKTNKAVWGCHILQPPITLVDCSWYPPMKFRVFIGSNFNVSYFHRKQPPNYPLLIPLSLIQYFHDVFVLLQLVWLVSFLHLSVKTWIDRPRACPFAILWNSYWAYSGKLSHFVCSEIMHPYRKTIVKFTLTSRHAYLPHPIQNRGINKFTDLDLPVEYLSYCVKNISGGCRLRNIPLSTRT